ncbi:MAG: FAD-binding protein, partial [Gammaproteobacteria bacterium]
MSQALHNSSYAERNSLINKLKKILPAQYILSEDEELRPYECDGLSAYRQLPWLVVLPGTIEQVQEILRTCYREKIPVVARGAGTGLSGGALPLEKGVLLSLSRFTEIIGIDPVNRTAKVQPGVRNLAISQAAEKHGLYYAPDPSSPIACTIGGNIAENS